MHFIMFIIPQVKKRTEIKRLVKNFYQSQNTPCLVKELSNRPTNRRQEGIGFMKWKPNK